MYIYKISKILIYLDFFTNFFSLSIYIRLNTINTIITRCSKVENESCE